MSDFTVSIKRWKNTITGEISYYAIIMDKHGRLRSAGDRHLKESDAESDAFRMFRNLPA
jgi:hypothetical protein